MTTNYKQPDDVTKRVRFYDGQFLQDQDFVDEQKYHLDRQARLGRCLQVAGIVDGLLVVATNQPFTIQVSPGTAVDLRGHSIVLANNRTELDKDGLPILVTSDTPLSLPSDSANSERLLYIAYYQMPVDLQQAEQGLQGETRWQEAPYIFVASQLVGADDDYGEPPWDTYLATRPAPVLLARLQIGSAGRVTVQSPRIYSGLRLPGPEDGASWVVDENGHVQLRYGQEDPTKIPLTIAENNVGIGTTSPQAGLHVYGEKYTLYGPNPTWGAYFQVGGNGRVTTHASIAASNGNLHIDARDGSYATYINYYSKNNTYLNPQGGNVGIGTASPGQRLDVAGNVKISGSGLYNANDFGIVQTDAKDWLRLNPDSAFPAIALYNPVAIGSGGLSVGDWSQLGQGQLKTTSTTLLAVNGGNVGIGTASPGQRLDVAGNVKISGSGLYNANDSRILQTDAEDWLRLNLDSAFPAIAMYNPVAIGTGGLSVGDWSQLGQGQLKTTSTTLLAVNSGNVGIGTASPQAGLHVYGEKYSLYGPNPTWGAYFQVGGNGRVTTHAAIAATNGNLHIDARDGNYATYINYYSKNNTYLNPQGGNVGIGTTQPSQKLVVAGNVMATGKFYSKSYDGVWQTIKHATSPGIYVWEISNPSDGVLKKNVTSLSSALEKIAQLNPVSFEWKNFDYFVEDLADDIIHSPEATEEQNDNAVEEARSKMITRLDHRRFGFLAQDVEKVFPDWITEDCKGYKNIDTSQLGALLVQAVRELSSKMESLEEHLSMGKP